MSNTAIKVENLSKRYRIGLKEQTHDTLTGAMRGMLASPLRRFKQLSGLASFSENEEDDILWALKGIDFEVKEGEVLGIIGKNGAGKSTLLKILSRITEPTTGKIVIDGRVASLLEVGTGFHPELTGRENVYLNGTILGMTRKEIDSKFDEIIDFSEVGKFIDTPVKRYSSGMKVRLGFAVAAHMDPEILIIDEVLAVGDFEFQKRCMGKMKDVASEGRTVLFVSHNLPLIKGLCSRGIVLKNGEIIYSGETESAINRYLNQSEETIKTNSFEFEQGGFKVSILMENEDYLEKSILRIGDRIKFKISITSTEKIKNVGCGIGINKNQQRQTTIHTFYQLNEFVQLEEGQTIQYDILWNNNHLVPGMYDFEFSVFSGEKALLNIRDLFSFELVGIDFYGNGQLPKPHMGAFMSVADWSYQIT